MAHLDHLRGRVRQEPPGGRWTSGESADASLSSLPRPELILTDAVEFCVVFADPGLHLHLLLLLRHRVLAPLGRLHRRDHAVRDPSQGALAHELLRVVLAHLQPIRQPDRTRETLVEVLSRLSFLARVRVWYVPFPPSLAPCLRPSSSLHLD